MFLSLMLHFFLTGVLMCHGADRLLVMIDPGHGGRDHGAVRHETQESRVTLSVSLALRDLLVRDKRFEAQMTRADDRHLSLSDRAHIANENGADVFLSIHVNSNPDSRARGAEFYFQNQLPPDEESMFLAHRENENDGGGHAPQSYPFLASHRYPREVAAIVTDLLDGVRILRSSTLSRFVKTNWAGTGSKVIRQAPFYVLSQMRSPSVLVELGFLTNEGDARDLADPAQQRRMAEFLYRGLIQYRESITNGHASRQSPAR